jgi:N-acyl-D-amino-acid deacylase
MELSEPLQPSRRDFLRTSAVVGLSSSLVGCSSLTHIFVRPPFDVLIRNGSLLDGTGAEEKKADIGIRDGLIKAIGQLSSADADHVIDATGLTVAPGFIDIHSHVDIELFKAPKAESKVRQGVTTEVTGCDGESVAPLGGPELDRTLADFKKEFGFDCPYRDMAGFFDVLQQRGCAQNLISFVGLGTLRGKIVGLDNRPATSEEMTAMKRELLSAIEQGCWGTSTGLEYTPGSFASTQELWELVKAAPEPYRIYASHLRNEDNTLLEAIEEAVTIARNSGASLQVSHLKAGYKINWHKQHAALEILEKAMTSGMNVHADRYTYIAYQTGLALLFPLWARDGGNEQFSKRLKDSSQLAAMRIDVDKKVTGLGSWDSVMISSVKNDSNKVYLGKTIQQIARENNVDPFEFCVALLLQEETNVGMVGFAMDEAGTEMILAWKNTMVASDAASYHPGIKTSPHPRAYGTFPRAIAHYQRTRKITTLPEMIRKMTSLPAEKLGLKDRGIIAEGKCADLVLFDYENIQDRATFLDPHQFPAGIPYVIINGVPVVENSIQNDELPGRVLRSNLNV